jgi:hypothetical protein
MERIARRERGKPREAARPNQNKKTAPDKRVQFFSKYDKCYLLFDNFLRVFAFVAFDLQPVNAAAELGSA